MNRDVLRQWVNVLVFVVTVTVNGLANALPLNGQGTGEISDRFLIYFVPAAYVFSIWGVIYLALLAFTVYQALPAQRENPRLRAIGYWFAVGNLANTVWIFLWHYEVFSLTLVAMLTLLVSLIIIYLRLNIGLSRSRPIERWIVDLPFSIYLGWITVATIANTTQLLYYLNWGGWGIAPEVWAVIIIFTGVIIAGLMAWTRADIVYLLVLIWAYIGIAIKHAQTPTVAMSAWIAAGLIGIGVIAAIFRVRSLPVARTG